MTEKKSNRFTHILYKCQNFTLKKGNFFLKLKFSNFISATFQNFSLKYQNISQLCSIRKKIAFIWDFIQLSTCIRLSLRFSPFPYFGREFMKYKYERQVDVTE